MFNKRGFTLIEILFVLAIVAAIALTGFRQYQLYQWRADAYTIRQSAAYLLQGLNSYYLQNCNSKSERDKWVKGDTIRFKEFKAKNEDGKYLPKNILASIRNPWAADKSQPFEDLIITLIPQQNTGDDENPETQRLVYSLKVTARLKQGGTILKHLIGILNAASAAGHTITWMRLPNQEIKGMNSGLWILNGGLQQFGQVIYKADNGRGIVQYCQARTVAEQ